MSRVSFGGGALDAPPPMARGDAEVLLFTKCDGLRLQNQVALKLQPIVGQFRDLSFATLLPRLFLRLRFVSLES